MSGGVTSVSSEIFVVPFPSKSVPASWQLEKCELRFHAIAIDWGFRIPGGDRVPNDVIPCAAWTNRDILKNLKASSLTLGCYFRLDLNSFATIVRATPQLEQFSGGRLGYFGVCLGGLRPTDLLAVSGWKHVRVCHITLTLTEEDLASPPAPRKFVKLNYPDLVPRLVNQWKEQLVKLEEMEVSCRVVEGDEYRKDEQNSPLIAVYPLIFGSKCDCSAIHFCIDAEDAMAKSLGILKPDE